MSTRSSRRLTEPERAERRRKERERVQQAAAELLSSAGWARWVRTRAMFHAYSAGNCMLLAAQAHARGLELTRVAGFRTWLKLGRVVRKGETGLRILAPIPIPIPTNHHADDAGDGSGQIRIGFRTAFVFDASQTDPLPGAELVALEPPREPLTGDSHAHLLAPLCGFAYSLGYHVCFEVIDGAVGGWCDRTARRIVIDASVPANAQLRTLIHECAHALGIDYRQYSRAQAEVMVDTVTLIAASAVGLAVDGETIAYVSGWGEQGALEAVTEFAETIDHVARQIETVLLTADANPDAAPPHQETSPAA